ncbi:MAG: tail fiber protein [Clostridia bacterium]|nr:tail fiber protein [Clostridia bacterium]
MNVNNTGAKSLVMNVGNSATNWLANSVKTCVYDGTEWHMSDAVTATTGRFGITKLSDAVNSTSTTLAATASAVKTAYDLANSKVGASQYTATLSSSGWSTSGGYKTQTVNVTGIKATYDVAPVVDCVLSGSDADADADILEGFGLISIITTASGSITAKCVGDAPSVNVPIVINVWE